MSKRLECPYCDSIIKETDTTCPQCGADCNKVIKEYQDEKLKERQAAIKDISKRMQRTIIIPIIAAIILVIIGIVLVFNVINNHQTKGIIDNGINTNSYTIKVDKFEEYEYYDDFFSDRCNTKEGYKKIAFKIVFENTSNKNVSTTDFNESLIVKADDEVLKRSTLTEDTNFCEVVKGTNSYNSFPNTEVLPKDKVTGYIGYQVPINAKKITFIFNKSQKITIDNPVNKD